MIVQTRADGAVEYRWCYKPYVFKYLKG